MSKNEGLEYSLPSSENINDNILSIGTLTKTRHYKNDWGIFEFISEDFQKFIVKGSPGFAPKEGETYIMRGEVELYKGEYQLSSQIFVKSLPLTSIGIRSYILNLEGMTKSIGTKIMNHYGNSAINEIENNFDEVVETIGADKKLMNDFRSQIVIAKNSRDVLIDLVDLGLTMNEASSFLETHFKDELSSYSLSDKVYEILDKNPYAFLTNVEGITFNKAETVVENIALSNKNDSIVNDRIKTAFVLTLSELTNLSGNSYTLRKNLVNKSLDLLNNSRYFESVERKPVRNIYDELINTGLIIQEKVKIKKKDQMICFPKTLFFAEHEIAKSIMSLVHESDSQWELKNSAENPIFINTATLEEDLMAELELMKVMNKLHFEEDQEDMIIESNFTKSGIHILTGNPGTGKTFAASYCFKLYKALYKITNSQALGLAPIGRAANVLSKSVGIPCLTIAKFIANIKTSTQEELEQYAKIQYIIIDETSMADTALFAEFFHFLKELIGVDAFRILKIIIIGDVDQLQSIGPGKVLADLIDSGLVPVTRLTVNKRQEKGSDIVENFYAVLEGKMPTILNGHDDYFYKLRNDDKKLPKIAINGYRKLISNGVDPMDIHVFSPVNKHNVGVRYFNAKAQEICNPDGENTDTVSHSLEEKSSEDGTKYRKIYFRLNDKVLYQGSNAYGVTSLSFESGVNLEDITKILDDFEGDFEKITNSMECRDITRLSFSDSLFNGEIGKLLSLNYKLDIAGNLGEILLVAFDDGNGYKVIQFSASSIPSVIAAKGLTLGYASTVHKGQGSQEQYVIFLFPKVAYKLLIKNSLYTGISRGQKMVFLVANKSALEIALSDKYKVNRKSRLIKRMNQYSELYEKADEMSKLKEVEELKKEDKTELVDFKPIDKPVDKKIEETDPFSLDYKAEEDADSKPSFLKSYEAKKESDAKHSF